MEIIYCKLDFYPRPPRGGRLFKCRNCGCIFEISIHALREEGDDSMSSCAGRNMRFLSTPSARRATIQAIHRIYRFLQFLSTASARRATGMITVVTDVVRDFYPRPPRGGRPASRAVTAQHIEISIHALREEGDTKSVRQDRSR